MTEPMKLPPVPPIPVELCYWRDGEPIAIKLLQIYGEQCAKAALESPEVSALRQDLLQCEVITKDLAFENEALRDALRNLYQAIDSCVELTPEVMRQAQAALAAMEKQK